MDLRFIVLGCLGTAVLTGCFVEDPLPMTPTSMTTAGTDDATEGTSTVGESMTSDGPTTNTPTTGPTTDGPTTTGPDDSTTDPTDPTVADSGTGCGMACEGIACGMADGCDESCGECNDAAVCADDQSYCGLPVGFPNDFGDEAGVFPLLQFGYRFQLEEPRVVRRLGVISRGSGPQIRMALYDHDGAGPNNLMVQTDAVALYTLGSNEFDVDPTPVPAGEYWVMLHTSINTVLARTFDGDNMYELASRASIPFGAGFPDVMVDEAIGQEWRYNLYAVVED
ncbi:MAG: hypothetical protein AB1Z98_21170 [Nannocystaceae bacterium]